MKKAFVYNLYKPLFRLTGLFAFSALACFSFGFSQTHSVSLAASGPLAKTLPVNLTPETQQKLALLKDWTILVYDLQSKKMQGIYPNIWEQPSIPASTYKVPHSLIGLNTGVITLQTVFPWNGQKHDIESWNRDHTLATAIQASCVPCYQQLARKIGVERMKSQLQKLNFGTMDVSAANLNTFWLEGKSQITPLQQVQFMARLALRQLPISKAVQDSVATIIADPVIPGLHAKTGWGRVPHKGFGDSIAGQDHYGWYVGYYQNKGKTYAFATRLHGQTPLPDGFAALRKEVTLAYLKTQKIML
jgi:beta-lactamase class D